MNKEENKMMNGFKEEVSGIYRLRVPFGKIYTSVFLIKDEGKNILVDTATTDLDIDNYVIPALRALGIQPCDITNVVITHNHADHAGGLPRLLFYAKGAEIVKHQTSLSKSVCTCSLPGHTGNFIGVLDMRSATLISGDGLQGAGVDIYRTSVESAASYKDTIEKIRKDERVKNLLFSHSYEPWYCDGVYGREDVNRVLSDCLNYIK